MSTTRTACMAALLSAVFTSAAFAQAASSPAGSDAGGDAVIVLVPVPVDDPSMRSGCWVQFYGERNFGGAVATLFGPVELQSLDKGTARQLQRDIDSLVTGPAATLTVYQHKTFRDKTVNFPPNSREAGLIRRLGFSGRIESMKLGCGG